MKVLNCHKVGDGYHFSVAATEEEIGSLVNIAISALAAMGYIDMEEAEYDEIEYDLSSIPVEEMFKA